jgi:uncharacterized protein YcfJ
LLTRQFKLSIAKTKETTTMKKVSLICSLILSVSLLSACQRSDVGLVGGGVIGGVAGNALTGGSGIGTAVGAVGGAFVGHQLAK